MHRKTLRWLRFFAIAVLIPVGTLIVGLRWENVFATIIAGVTGISLSLAFLELQTERHAEAEERVSEVLPRISQVTPIRENNWYDTFRASLQCAKYTANLSYFHNQPPTHKGASQDRQAYYKDIFRIMKSNDQVRFRRIDRGHPELREWIARVIAEMNRRGNFSYAIWLDERPLASSLELVAVQTIDDTSTFFVAVGRQEAPGGFRDVHVESKECNESWNHYYNRLWNDKDRCVVVIERGRLDEAALKRVHAHLDTLQEQLGLG